MTTFTQNLTRARSHIFMVIGLLGGLGMVFALEGPVTTSARAAPPMDTLAQIRPLQIAAPHPLRTEEIAAAAIAWRYFSNNISTATGLVASVDQYPSTTMWETGSLVVAILSAERLGLISAAEGSDRLAKVVESLSQLPLAKEGLPNKAYDITSLAIVDYNNKPSATGLGWSALDIGRLLAALMAAERTHPELAGAIQRLVAGWDLTRLVAGGELVGGNVTNGKTAENQEGRIGYEQYAAKAMIGFGLDATKALDMAGHLTLQDVGGVAVPTDTRLNAKGMPAATTSEPYLLDGLEFGFDWRSQIFASQVYRVQEQRFAQTGKLTAVSEGHLDVKPYFAYGTVWGGGQDWAVISFAGERMDSSRVLSTKAAFGWNALFGTPYTEKLVAAVASLAVPDRGWQEGTYEATGKPDTAITANTNSMILAAIAFSSAGPLVRTAN
jgi:hypothetical protein